jgi:hypothetical protein
MQPKADTAEQRNSAAAQTMQPQADAAESNAIAAAAATRVQKQMQRINAIAQQQQLMQPQRQTQLKPNAANDASTKADAAEANAIAAAAADATIKADSTEPCHSSSSRRCNYQSRRSSQSNAIAAGRQTQQQKPMPQPEANAANDATKSRCSGS